MKIALTIAGFDPSGGAGLQADLKTFEAFGVYGASVMTCLAVQNSKKFLYAKPVQITGKENNAVLISGDDWRAVQETLYLLAVPKMRESILKVSKHH